MKISTEQIWDEMTALMRGHHQIIIAVAGVFLFLPAMASGLFLDPAPMGTTPDAVMKGVTAWLQTHWLAVTAQVIVTTFGGTALYRCLLASKSIAAGEALVQAVPMLLFVLLANLGTSFFIVIGLNLFILPGLYVAGRLILVTPALVAQRERNILTGLGDSFRLTQGNGWRLIGMLMTMSSVIFIAVLTASMIVGAVAGLTLPVGFASLISVFMQAMLVTLWSVGGILMAAGAYRIAMRGSV